MSAILCSYNCFQEAPQKSREVLSMVEKSVLAGEIVKLMSRKFDSDLVGDCNYLIDNFPRIEFRRRLNERFAKIAILAVLTVVFVLFASHFFLQGYNALYHMKWYVYPVVVSVAFVWFWDMVLDKEWVNFFLGKEGGHVLEPFLIEYDERATQVSLACYACKKYQKLVGEIQQPEEFKQRFEDILKRMALQIVTLQKKKKLLKVLSEAEDRSCYQLSSELRDWSYDASEWLQFISGNITPYFQWAEAECKRKVEQGEIETITNYQI